MYHALHAVEILWRKTQVKSHIKPERGEDMCLLDMCILYHDQMNKHYPPLVQWPTQLCDIVFV